MPVLASTADEHIDRECTRLARFAARRAWPKYLFHTAQVEVVAEILRSGSLLARASQERLVHDVANQGAIAINPNATKYARLYFRPKTPFHLKTEGIKKADDPYRDERHMSIPVTLVFDLKSVIMLPTAGFCNGKLAHAGREPEFSDEYFRSIDFHQVYHDSPTSPENGDEIREMRMSEVVVPDQLPLEPISEE